MFNLLLTITSLFGYVFSAHRITKIPVQFSPIFSIALLLLCLYGFALAGFLVLGLAILWWAGLLLFAYSVVFSRREIIAARPVYICYLLLLLCLFIGLHHTYFSGWDEFSFWGLVSKVIYQTHSLPTAATPISFKDYPVICALFHNWIYYGLAGFTEGNAYFAQMILLFSALFILVDEQSWQKGMVVLAIAGLAVSFFDKGFLHSLYVDDTVACWAAAACLIYLSDQKRNIITILPIVMILPLIKQVGYLFAWLTIALVVTDRLWLIIYKKVSWRQLLLEAGILIAAVIAVHYSWVTHYQYLHVTKTFQTHTISLKKIVMLLFSNSDPFTTTVKQRYGMAILFMGQSLNRLHISSITWIVFLCGVFYLMIRGQQEKLIKLRYLNVLLILLVGFVIYALGLLILYCNSYATYEALTLASFGRYFSIYLLFFTLITLGLFQRGIHKNSPILSLFIIGLFVAALLWSAPTRLEPQRQLIVTTVNQIKPFIVNPPKNIYLIYQDDNGNWRDQLTYELWPNSISSCNSLGLPYDKQDVWTCNYSLLQLKNNLMNYQYLLLARIDERFLKQYGSLFPGVINDQQVHFYRIKYQGNDLRLEKIL